MEFTDMKKTVLFWLTAIFGLAIVVLLALVLITPRVINTDSVRQSIENTISKELAGTLTYDHVELSVFPWPRIVIHKPNLMIPGSISGSFGSLDIYPDILPLFSGKFQIAKALIKRPKITIILPEETKKMKTKSTTRSAPIEAVLEAAAGTIPNIQLIVERGQLTLVEGKRTIFVLSDLKTRVAFQAAPRKEELPQTVGSAGDFRIAGSAAFTVSEGGAFPGAIRLTIEQFEILPKTISFTKVRAWFLDSAITVSGKFEEYLTALRKADISLNGDIGRDTVQWIRTETDLPFSLTIHAPLSVSKVRLWWNRAGSVQLQGSAKVEDGAALSFDIAWSPKSIVLKDLRLRDNESDARFFLKREQQILDFSFSGNLTKSTLNRFFEYDIVQFGWIKGDVRVHANYDRPEQSTVEGMVEGEGLVIPYNSKTPLVIDHLSLQASGKQILLNPLALKIGKDAITAKGSIAISEQGLNLNVDVSSERSDWDSLQVLLASDRDEQGENGESVSDHKKITVLGLIRISIDAMSIGRYTAREIQAKALFEKDRTRIELNKATLCGVALPGAITITPDDIQLEFRPFAADQELGPVLACFSGEDFRVTGLFELAGHLAMSGTKETLFSSLHGSVSLTAKNGRVFRDLVILRVLSFLTVSELFKGNYAKLEKEGLPYHSFSVKAEIRNSNISLQDADLKSRVANMTGHGTINLHGKSMYLRLRVAPFTTVDTVVKNVPLVGNILGGSLVTIPVRIAGPFNNPEIKVLK